MQNHFTAACIQMNSGAQVADNLRRADALLAKAAAGGAQLAALPEFFALLSADEQLAIAESEDGGAIQDFLSAAAARYQMYIVGGTLPIVAPDSRVFSSCLLYAPDGERIARYDKMHLFRFFGKTRMDETVTIAPGDSPLCVQTPLGKIGLAVCYDLRFPELFRAMDTPDIIVAPAAFTPQTGNAHWHILLRARAVDNIAHIIAPAQAGEHPGGRQTFGHSAIVDGWGNILAAAAGCGDEVIFAEIDGTERNRQREMLPILSHRLIHQTETRL